MEKCRVFSMICEVLGCGLFELTSRTITSPGRRGRNTICPAGELRHYDGDRRVSLSRIYELLVRGRLQRRWFAGVCLQRRRSLRGDAGAAKRAVNDSLEVHDIAPAVFMDIGRPARCCPQNLIDGHLHVQRIGLSVAV